jgi:hypothetical protein
MTWQEMEGECKKMQKEAEEDFGDGCLARWAPFLFFKGSGFEVSILPTSARLSFLR